MYILNCVAGFLSGLLSSMGFGGGSVLIIYLTNFQNMPQKEAQGINLAFFIPVALYSVISYGRKGFTDKKTIIPYILFGIPGVIVGYALMNVLPSEYLSKVFGGFLIVTGIRELSSVIKKFRRQKK